MESDKKNFSEDINLEFIDRKKELILKEYDSLFAVYGRETSIVYSFRGWAITILTIYFTFLFTIKPTTFAAIYLPGLIIIATFFLLELSERSIMLSLLHELRSLEEIFVIENNSDFAKAIKDYEFRDMKEVKKRLTDKVNNFIKSIFSMKVIFWNFFLILIYIIIIHYYKSSFTSSEKALERERTNAVDCLKK